MPKDDGARRNHARPALGCAFIWRISDWSGVCFEIASVFDLDQATPEGGAVGADRAIGSWQGGEPRPKRVGQPAVCGRLPLAGGGAAPRRDPPPDPGHVTSVRARFRRWSRAGVWEAPFKALRDDPAFEHAPIDAAISKVHADAPLSQGGLKRAPSDARGAA